MPITYNPDDVSAGTYLCKFLGYKTVEIENSQFGSGPRYEWSFQVVEGPETGRVIKQLTGTDARSSASLAYQFLVWFLGRAPARGEIVEPNEYIGRQYRVKWQVNPRSEKGRCKIMDLEPVGVAPASSAPAARPVPPVPPRAPTTPASSLARYWVLNEKGQVESEPLLASDIQTRVSDGEVLQLQDEAQTQGWKPARECGFTREIPF